MSMHRSLSDAAGIPHGKWDFENSTQMEQWKAYGATVSEHTAGFGIALMFVLGLLMSILAIVFCCRCRSLRRIDREIGEGKGFHDQAAIAYRVTKQRKLLWVGTVMLVVGYAACAGVAYEKALSTDVAFGNAYDGADKFALDLQKAVCAQDGARECEDKSLGAFLEAVYGATTAVLNGTAAFLGTAGITMTSNTTLYGMLTCTPPPPLIAAPPPPPRWQSEGRPRDIERYASTAGVTATSNTTLYAMQGPLGASATFVASEIDAEHGNEVDGVPDLREGVTVVLDATLTQLRNFTRTIYKYQTGAAVDVDDAFNQWIKPAAAAAGGIVFLPGIVLVLLAFCTAMCKNPRPLYLNMAFVYKVQGFYCLLGGLFLTLAYVNSDLCDQHKEIIVEQFPKTSASVAAAAALVVLPNMAAARNGYDPAAALAKVTAKRLTLPDTNFNRTDPAQQALFDAQYLDPAHSDSPNPAFRWDDSTITTSYAAALDNFNSLMLPVRANLDVAASYDARYDVYNNGFFTFANATVVDLAEFCTTGGVFVDADQDKISDETGTLLYDAVTDVSARGTGCALQLELRCSEPRKRRALNRRSAAALRRRRDVRDRTGAPPASQAQSTVAGRRRRKTSEKPGGLAQMHTSCNRGAHDGERPAPCPLVQGALLCNATTALAERTAFVDARALLNNNFRAKLDAVQYGLSIMETGLAAVEDVQADAVVIATTSGAAAADMTNATDTYAAELAQLAAADAVITATTSGAAAADMTNATDTYSTELAQLAADVLSINDVTTHANEVCMHACIVCLRTSREASRDVQALPTP
ncbi:hypothetical protein JKP88DRAFT_253938 [Tribonema minus]|uniref:Uncharacterized protein n=1 Tax=Tribonema minus TaxID=303371 RepID=A0A836CLF9_9STRA|nr:hypothetical protein JKP88DRAFT_253938 [Tribonema minus]